MEHDDQTGKTKFSAGAAWLGLGSYMILAIIITIIIL